MKLSTLPSKTAVHCETQEEFDRIDELVSIRLGIPKLSGYEFERHSETVIYPIYGGYGNLHYATENGYTIISSTKIE